jgi:hypothetical protein
MCGIFVFEKVKNELNSHSKIHNINKYQSIVSISKINILKLKVPKKYSGNS